MNIYYLADAWPWLGEHTGYHRLPHYVQKAGVDVNVTRMKYGLLERCVGRVYSVCHGRPGRRDSIFAEAEFRFSRFLKKPAGPGSVFHVLYFDNHHPLWDRRNKYPGNIMATVHHALPENISGKEMNSLKRLFFAVVLCSRDLKFYEKHIGKGRVAFIPHGVDTDFFHPAKKNPAGSKRIMFTGQNGRNFKMLGRVIDRLTKIYPELRYDLLVPRKIREMEGLRQLIGHPNVEWHENIFNDKLRALYQKNHLLLMPMDMSAANNATVEAMASGLPVVTTDVGGIRDYGGGSVYPLVANDDDDGMIKLIEKYLRDPGWYNEIARKCRQFAEQKLNWPLIAEKHIEVYRKLTRIG